MIALVVATFLIVQTYDGQTHLAGPLSDEGCEAARCLSQYGQTCEAKAKEQAAFKRRQEEEKAHPTVCTTTFGGIVGGVSYSCAGSDSLGGEGMVRSASATKKAMCVK